MNRGGSGQSARTPGTTNVPNPALGLPTPEAPAPFFPQPKKNKYKASKQRYKGSLYDSRKEANYAATLDMLKKATDPRERVKKWDRQVRVPLIVNGKLIANWYCDFEVTYADGRKELHEVKGFDTEVWRLKRKLFEALYPKRPMKVIR
jgi:Protein of unknown function (DUF1064)